MSNSVPFETAFENLVSPYFDEGLKAALLTDRDGVIIVKVLSPDSPPKAIDPIISTTFAVTSDQASKVGLKGTRSIVTIYGSHQLIQYNLNPLLITIVADAEANTGILIDLGSKLCELSTVVVQALNERTEASGGVDD